MSTALGTYERLPNDVVKSCFLYFSLFPVDFTILKKDLVDLWISEEFLGHYDDTRDDSLNLGHSIINTLIRARLLEERNDYVGMNHEIRGFALWLLSASDILESPQLPEASGVANLTGVGRILSMQDFIQDNVNVPLHLLTFFFLHNPFIMIRGAFSQFMDSLTVLDLSNACIEEVPGDISRFVSLQHLNLSHTCIDRLPVEFKALVKLKGLNLEHNYLLRVIPKQVIAALSSLQVLRMFRCGFSVEEIEDNLTSATNMNIDELQHLEHVKVLSITITCAAALQKFFGSHNLARYTEALSLECFWRSRLIDISPLSDMNHLVTLEIHHAEHLKKLTVNCMLRERSFNSLRQVCVENCSSLRDLTWLILAPNLAVLRVKYCGDMEEVISIGSLGEIQEGCKNLDPFAKLEVIELEYLSKLKRIYWNALPFQSLQKIKVSDCQLLKKLPLDSYSTEGNEVIIEAEIDWWKEIEWEDDATKHNFLPCFRNKMID